MKHDAGRYEIIKGTKHISSNLPERVPLYNKSLSIKGNLILPINE